MHTFYKKNKVISWFGLLSLFVVVSYVLSMDIPEWFDGAGDWFNILFQLAIGFLINFMFYITQVYIPQQKQNEQAYKCIVQRLDSIVLHMKNVFEELCKIYLNKPYEIDNLTDEQLLDILHHINGNDYVSVLNQAKLDNVKRVGEQSNHFTVSEYLTNEVLRIEWEIDKTNTYYAAYITPELMNIMYTIPTSRFHENLVKSLLRIPAGITFSCPEDDFLKPYYEMMKKLQEERNTYDESK